MSYHYCRGVYPPEMSRESTVGVNRISGAAEPGMEMSCCAPAGALRRIRQKGRNCLRRTSFVDHTQHITEFFYAFAFRTGLLGSGHCLGMCGAQVWGFFMKVSRGGTAAYLA